MQVCKESENKQNHWEGLVVGRQQFAIWLWTGELKMEMQGKLMWKASGVIKKWRSKETSIKKKSGLKRKCQ